MADAGWDTHFPGPDGRLCTGQDSRAWQSTYALRWAALISSYPYRWGCFPSCPCRCCTGVRHGCGVGRCAGRSLSLAVCKGIVEAHGGRIWAESDGPGLGMRCTFTVPTVEETAHDVHGELSPVALRRAERSRVRVLVVEEDPQSLRYVRDVLTGSGYAPVATTDPADVPRLMGEARPHVVLLGLAVPGVGIEVMNDILRAADVPVIFLSAYGRDEECRVGVGYGSHRLRGQTFFTDGIVGPGPCRVAEAGGADSWRAVGIASVRRHEH